jgi:hypothetical protein
MLTPPRPPSLFPGVIDAERETMVGGIIRKAVEHDSATMRFYLTCSVGELAQRIVLAMETWAQQDDVCPCGCGDPPHAQLKRMQARAEWAEQSAHTRGIRLEELREALAALVALIASMRRVGDDPFWKPEQQAVWDAAYAACYPPRAPNPDAGCVVLAVDRSRSSTNAPALTPDGAE